jgi:hypothetical protein
MFQEPSDGRTQESAINSAAVRSDLVVGSINSVISSSTRLVLVAAAAVVVAVGASTVATPSTPARQTVLTSAQSDYIEHCGGCHGIQGRSFPARVPQLRDKVGYFLCNERSRRYLLQLPNVALSPTDDAQLADIMNFVVFGLGGASARPGARPFTAEEVAATRHQPLATTSLVKMRAELVHEVIRDCKVSPRALSF